MNKYEKIEETEQRRLHQHRQQTGTYLPRVNMYVCISHVVCIDFRRCTGPTSTSSRDGPQARDTFLLQLAWVTGCASAQIDQHHQTNTPTASIRHGRMGSRQRPATAHGQIRLILAPSHNYFALIFGTAHHLKTTEYCNNRHPQVGILGGSHK